VGAATGCAALGLNAGQNMNGHIVDQYTWSDGACTPRSAGLVRSDWKGGHAKQFTYQVGGSPVVVNQSPEGDAGPGGFGYIVSHLSDAEIPERHGDLDGDSPFGSSRNAQYRTVFLGHHHAIHEFTSNYPRWGVDPVTNAETKYDMPVTIHWLFATGRDHPLWSVTFDLSHVPANAVNADVRAPYGDMNFDGAPSGEWGADIGGVAWGESYRFRTLGDKLSLNSAWDWSAPNRWAPYHVIWTHGVDAEMGIAGVQVSNKQDAGGYQGVDGRGSSSADTTYHCPDGYIMPCTWGWAYQSVNYSLDQTNPARATFSKRLAWGTDFGFLGQQTVTTVNQRTVQGWPKVSYSVYVVLGPHSRTPTMAMAEQAAVIDATSLTATVGTVTTLGPAGVNRAETVLYQPAGYSPVYGTWEATSANANATLTFSIAGGTPLINPVIVVHGLPFSDGSGGVPPTNVALDGVPLTIDQDFFASYRADTQESWFTLNTSLTGERTLSIWN
jgi:hypothetical protein